jgi:hypothetical protein
MVKPTDARKCDDPASALGGWTARATGASRSSDNVRSVLLVVGDMQSDQAEQMPFPKHDDVIEQLTA